MNNLKYKTEPMMKLTDSQLEACSKLFSEHYGKYASDNHLSEDKWGKHVRMSASYYRKNYCKPDFYISYAKNGSQHIAHAIYLRKQLEDKQVMTWVVQLVVHANYRGKEIGKKLLNSAWGFSNDAGWGLATSNPYTIKTLEASTFRKVNPEYVVKHLTQIKEMAQLINFVSDFKVEKEVSIVESNFYVDHSEIDKNIASVFGTSNWLLGKLDPGQEWLAFTFGDQDFDSEYDNEFIKLMNFSETKLKEAYGRMSEHQGWQEKTQYEVEYILQKCSVPKSSVVLDFGCGNGRHARALADKGMHVVGIDFSKKNKSNQKQDSLVEFVNGDCRNYKHDSRADMIVCLYDVIGSFPEDKDNDAIIDNAYANLKKEGYFAVSVMNMELTKHLAKPEYTGDVMKNLKVLQSLPASNTMQATGNIFNPEYYFLDSYTNVVYRKEQFKNDQNLSAEHIIRDRRYSVEEFR